VTPPDGLEHRRPRRFFVAIGLVAALAPLNSTMVAVALPSIGAHFDVDPGTLTLWLVTSYLFVSVIGQSPCGKLGDLWDQERVLTLGRICFGIGAALGSLTPNFVGLVVARVLMAAGGSLILPTVFAILRNSVAPERRPSIFGIFGAVMGVSAAIGPSLGGLLTKVWGWQAVFLVNVPILLLSVALQRSVARSRAPRTTSDEPRGRPRFDVPGSVLLAATIFLLVAMAKIDGSVGLRIGLLSSGLVLAGVFIWWERRVPAPVMDPRLFKNGHFAAGSLVISLQYMAMYAVIFQIPFLLEGRFEGGAHKVGAFLLLMTGAMVLSSVLGGRISQRIGARATAILGSTSAVLGMIALASTTSSGQSWGLVFGLLAIGAGVGLSMAPSQSAALSAIDPDQSGMASGAMGTLRYLGGLIAITFVSVILAGGAGEARFRMSLWAFTVVLVLSGIAATALPGRPASPLEDK